jgi:hypothetical protein
MNLINTTTALLLDVAREAILLRARRDNQNAKTYDTERDPEGYITSILCAFRHWCHRNHIPWTSELKKANDFFRKDLGDHEKSPRIKHLECPSCSHRGSFKIQVKEYLLMFHDYLELDRSQDAEWDHESRCVCPSCNHQGIVSQFQAKG